jgi:hypothetical protein
MESGKKLFRSILYNINGISTTSKFQFSLQLPSNDYKYIELVSYGIHSTNAASQQIYYLELPQLFNNRLILHATNNFAFLNFCHGIIQSIDNQSINNILHCNITPSIVLNAGGDSLNIVFYFVIHY